jgi:hypothetical protein
MTTQENNIYELIELFPQAEAYVGIRQAAGLSLVSYQAAVLMKKFVFLNKSPILSHCLINVVLVERCLLE